jgi:phosphopantothenoylcysteine decarboxylase/phosphopantothenate--cysteine ligase
VHPVDDIRGTLSSRLEGRTIVLGVTGSIAAVECVQLARELARHGAKVIAAMTPAATKIIHPDAMWFATGERPVVELTGDVEHVRWAGDTEGRADLLLVAPATANTIGKIAHAVDDTPVTTFATTALGTGIPVVVAPAMHGTMWQHQGVPGNIELLRGMGVEIVQPREEEKKAKLADTETIVAHCVRALAPDGPLKGGRIIVLAGSTEEPVDRVRLLSNRSTGGLGRALAEEAFLRGAEVTVLLGRHEAPPPPYVEVSRFSTVDSLVDAVMKLPKDPTTILSAAAIADYRLETPREDKVPSGQEGLELRLSPAPKVLPALREAAPGALIVSFKLEVDVDDEGLEAIARARLERGIEDLVVANDLARVTPGNHPALIVAEGEETIRVAGSKADLASAVLDAVERAAQ